MSAPQETVWEMDPHTGAKHRILREWWNGWLPKASTGQRRVLYFDAFAGPGIYKGGQPGSPIVSLQEAIGHSQRKRFEKSECLFILVEERADRAAELERQVDKLKPGMPKAWGVSVENTTFVKSIEPTLKNLESKGAQLAPTFAFIDPFGFGDIPMDLVARILSFDRCDVLITFNARDMSRFAESDHHDEAIDRCIGDAAWRDSLPDGLAAREAYFLKTYESRLKARVEGAMVRSFEISGEAGPIYYLVGATKHLEGVRVMKRAMWVADPTGEYHFSDRTAGLRTLLEWGEKDPWGSAAADAVYVRFAGKTVPVEEVERFVLVETPWPWKKRPILGPLSKDGRLLAVDGASANSWPEGSSLSFRSC